MLSKAVGHLHLHLHCHASLGTTVEMRFGSPQSCISRACQLYKGGYTRLTVNFK